MMSSFLHFYLLYFLLCCFFTPAFCDIGVVVCVCLVDNYAEGTAGLCSDGWTDRW